ncbi:MULTISPECIES: hypothetical protein [unclassified Rhodococcus (in: high G+C Gram-positive bacteria)]|uniref:hypothetical protein n=1 Tax=unclassified Rhodococcus (in: high G+C Gram-positive bacteria) TaxID=192944 RepID=UPI00178C21B2|nr:hypothetical protein [Rhodococcus sp. DK17]
MIFAPYNLHSHTDHYEVAYRAVDLNNRSRPYAHVASDDKAMWRANYRTSARTKIIPDFNIPKYRQLINQPAQSGPQRRRKA